MTVSAKNKKTEYLVLSPILYEKERYEVKATVSMEQEYGEPLVEQGVLELLEKTTADK